MSRYNRLCKNKRRYGTKQLAIDVAKMSKDQNHPKLRYYACPFCH